MVAHQTLTLVVAVQVRYPLPITIRRDVGKVFERIIIMSMYNVPDHPDIRSALLTGYPRGGQSESIFCDECFKDITEEDKYDDCQHGFLCRDCLLSLHFKGW